jgi:DnaJ-domain-containing protein 1
MTDNFALLEQPRRPWLDVDALKAKFLALSASVHPDRVHSASESERKAATEQYAQLNAAYNCLRETKERLAHLLQLELGAKPGDVQKLPASAMDLFMEIGTTLRETDSFLAENSKVTSPLLKVQMFEKGMEWTDRLNALQKRLNESRDQLHRQLRAINVAWESTPQTAAGRTAALPLAQLEEIYRAISFVARWSEQIQQRIVQLSL